MNYIYGVLLLHSTGKELNEENLKKVLEATGEKTEEAQLKALVSNLKGVNIEDAIKQSVALAAPSAGPAKEEKKEEAKVEEKKEESVEGLAGLFG